MQAATTLFEKPVGKGTNVGACELRKNKNPCSVDVPSSYPATQFPSTEHPVAAEEVNDGDNGISAGTPPEVTSNARSTDENVPDPTTNAPFPEIPNAWLTFPLGNSPKGLNIGVWP